MSTIPPDAPRGFLAIREAVSDSTQVTHLSPAHPTDSRTLCGLRRYDTVVDDRVVDAADITWTTTAGHTGPGLAQAHCSACWDAYTAAAALEVAYGTAAWFKDREADPVERNPDVLGRRLCEALGLDPHQVSELTLKYAAGSVPTINVTRPPSMSDGTIVTGVVEEFDLVARPAGQQAPDVDTALEVLMSLGQIDGAHHKAWVIDQTARALLGPAYEQTIAEWRTGDDGPNTYSWDEGIAP